LLRISTGKNKDGSPEKEKKEKKDDIDLPAQRGMKEATWSLEGS
jgi:hypothetical protein